MARGFIEQASEIASEVDAVFLYLLGVSSAILFILALCGSWFIWRYRSSNTSARGCPPLVNSRLEWGWTAAALVLALVSFYWAADVYLRAYAQPRTASLTITAEAKQWMWKFWHPSGQDEINELHLPLGVDTQVLARSSDVIHSFYIPAFRIKRDILPGRITRISFRPTMTGNFHLFCAEYCGTDHAEMRGRVVVLSKSDYAAWSKTTTNLSPQAKGEILFQQFGCQTCHEVGGGIGPPLQGLLGRYVRLSDGRVILADEEYIEESIRFPQRKVHDGFAEQMPSYDEQLTSQQLLELISYIRSLSPSKLYEQKNILGDEGTNE